MDLSAAAWWWIATGIAVAAELATGTFYLLMLALGLGAAAIAAHLGAGLSAQLVTAAVVGGGAVTLWRWHLSKNPKAPRAEADRDVNLDVGERVHVSQWAADRTARVQYRGATWTARYAGTGDPQPGEHVIRAVEGNRLIVGP
jgi:membrane protein implicated in regulation of membrane protease activity